VAQGRLLEAAPDRIAECGEEGGSASSLRTVAHTELGNGAIAITADVTDRAALVAAADRVNSELGGADILVNNAGVMLLAPFSAAQHAESREMIEVNLLGAMTATEVFLDQLRDGEPVAITAQDIAEIIAFAITRPHRRTRPAPHRLSSEPRWACPVATRKMWIPRRGTSARCRAGERPAAGVGRSL